MLNVKIEKTIYGFYVVHDGYELQEVEVHNESMSAFLMKTVSYVKQIPIINPRLRSPGL
jgi:hypothetical protein